MEIGKDEFMGKLELGPMAEEVAAEEEEDGPLEDWTRKELSEECKTLGPWAVRLGGGASMRGRLDGGQLQGVYWQFSRRTGF